MKWGYNLIENLLPHSLLSFFFLHEYHQREHASLILWYQKYTNPISSINKVDYNLICSLRPLYHSSYEEKFFLYFYQMIFFLISLFLAKIRIHTKNLCFRGFLIVLWIYYFITHLIYKFPLCMYKKNNTKKTTAVV